MARRTIITQARKRQRKAAAVAKRAEAKYARLVKAYEKARLAMEKQNEVVGQAVREYRKVSKEVAYYDQLLSAKARVPAFSVRRPEPPSEAKRKPAKRKPAKRKTTKRKTTKRKASRRRKAGKR